MSWWFAEKLPQRVRVFAGHTQTTTFTSTWGKEFMRKKNTTIFRKICCVFFFGGGGMGDFSNTQQFGVAFVHGQNVRNFPASRSSLNSTSLVWDPVEW